MEEKRLGDNAVTEGWAMLFDHLIDDRAWLSSMLSFPKPDVFAAEGAVQLLFYVRRYCAKLLYEIEFHAAPDVTQMRSRYVELLGDALKVEPSPTDYLADIDSGYYVTSYLRAWAFAAQMTSFMREEFGTDWFKRREAGSLLVELWALGQKPNADELLKDVTGAAVEMEAVAEHVALGDPDSPPRAASGVRRGRERSVAPGRRGARPGLRRRRQRAPLERVHAPALTREVVLDQHHVVPRALDDGQQRAHRRDLLALLLQEPVQELLADQVALGARELGEVGDLLGHALLLLQRQPDGLDHVGERRLRLGDARDRDALVGVEQVLDDHHRVVALLDRLAVEVRGEPRQRLRVVVDGDRRRTGARPRTRARPARSTRPGKAAIRRL